MEFCFGLFQGSGPKLSASWIHLLFLCSMLPTWSNVEGWSYFYSNTTMTWENARNWCRKNYTDMVAIQNQEEIQYLNGILPHKSTYYWIGIRKINNAWTWVGTNKKLTTEATNWAKNEPNNGKNGGLKGGAEDCVEMYVKREAQTGKWNDERCDKLKAALCYSAACKNDSCHFGECIETINSHKCNCTPGFFGDKCDQIVKCDKDKVSAPENGNIDCTHEYGDFSFNSSCRYSCKEGYQLSVEKPQRCNEYGSWSEQHPTCELVQCENLTLPSRASMTCSDPLGPSSYGSTCVYTCDEGYVFDGSPSNALTLQCESSGSWNASQPSCAAVQCPVLQHLENGIMSCESEEDDRFSFGKTCSFICSPGYQLLGQSRLTCTSAAEWSEQMPRCEAITCKNPEREAHLIVNCHKSLREFPINSTCSFTCEQGFELQGVQTAKCSEDGHWSEETPACRAVQCLLLEAPKNGHINCSNSEPLFNTQCSFTSVQCPVLQHLENGIMSCESEEDDRFSFGKTCSFICSPGYQLLGQSRLTCTSAAEWSEQMPRCEAITCKNPEREAHLIVNCHKSLREFPINSTCSFTCEQGFELQGVQTAKCSEDGHWSEETPTCRAVQCLLLEAPKNGHINCSNSEPLFNTQCSFTCDQDYSLNGHEMLTCDHHGNWTGGNPICEASSPSVIVTATSAAAGAASVASGLCLALWILKRLRQKASNFALNSTSEVSMPAEVYKSSIDSLI